MPKLTQETEDKLLRVIDKTAALVDEGMTPDDAVIKAAMAQGLRPGDIEPVVHAYNTGRTLRQRADGEDIFSKVADFQLANLDNILTRLYPEAVEKAASVATDTVVSPEYGISPQSMLERKSRWEKRAADVDWRIMDGKEIPAAPPLAKEDDAYQRVQVKMASLKQAAEESRRKAASAFDQMGKTFMELSDYFRRTDAKPIPVVKEAVMVMHGDKGERIFDELIKVSPSLMKLANHREGSSLLGTVGQYRFKESADTIDCTAEPFPLVAQLIQDIQTHNRLKAAAAVSLETYEKEAAELMAPFCSPAVSSSILGTSSEEQEKTANILDGPLRTLGAYSIVNNTMLQPIAKRLKGPSADEEAQKAMESLNDPAHESQLRAINAQSTLQDLMSNDDVISSYSPEQVANAYNDIVQISPSVADQRMLIQSLLRKQLQQDTLDTFEQDQLLGFEDKLRKQQNPMGKGGNGSVI